MIVLPLYAISIWLVIFAFRRRWQGFLIWSLSAFPVGLLTHVCVSYVPLPDHEPRPVWLYGIAASYALLIVLIGLLLVVQRGRPAYPACHSCGYDLAGNETGVCPECGTPVRCRCCDAELTSLDFRECHVCAEPFPLFPAREPDAARLPAPPSSPRDPRERARRFARSRAVWAASTGPEPADR